MTRDVVINVFGILTSRLPYLRVGYLSWSHFSRGYPTTSDLYHLYLLSIRRPQIQRNLLDDEDGRITCGKILVETVYGRLVFIERMSMPCGNDTTPIYFMAKLAGIIYRTTVVGHLEEP